MKKLVDLHLHSTCSDGLYPPAEVVRLAAAAGLAAIALCDHDNVDGIDAALAAGVEHGVEVLSGVELSTVWESHADLHLLGYGFDHHQPELRASLAEFRAFREGRNERIVARINEKLAGEGWGPIAFEKVLARAGGTVGRPHIAQELIAHGYVKNTEEAFTRFLVPCNVEKRFFPFDAAIELVHRAGGVAVLAHPPFITTDRKVLGDLLDTFVTLGLDGVEAWNSGASRHDIEWYITLARRRGLLVTGGSDFHGSEQGAVKMGSGRGQLRIPYACVEELQTALAARRQKAAR
jgi:3',5'-nucleoside bisphosphate phosphatase